MSSLSTIIQGLPLSVIVKGNGKIVILSDSFQCEEILFWTKKTVPLTGVACNREALL